MIWYGIIQSSYIFQKGPYADFGDAAKALITKKEYEDRAEFKMKYNAVQNKILDKEDLFKTQAGGSTEEENARTSEELEEDELNTSQVGDRTPINDMEERPKETDESENDDRHTKKEKKTKNKKTKLGRKPLAASSPRLPRNSTMEIRKSFKVSR